MAELLEAAKIGDLKSVQRLIETNDENDLFKIDSKGCTALHLACQNGHHDVVLKLAPLFARIQYNYWPSLDIKNQNNETALVVAIIHGYPNIALSLVETAGIDLKYDNGIVDLALKKSYLDLTLALLRKGASSVNQQNVELVKLLKSNGCVNADVNGNTALTLVCKNLQLYHLIPKLIAKEANINFQSRIDLNKSPLHLICFRNNDRKQLHDKAKHDMARLLLKKGAHVNAIDANGSTPLHYASQAGYKLVCEALIEYGSNMNVQDKVGDTPIHKACSSGTLDVIRLLITHKAETHIINTNKQTALKNLVHRGKFDKIEQWFNNTVKFASRNPVAHFPINSETILNLIEETLRDRELVTDTEKARNNIETRLDSMEKTLRDMTLVQDTRLDSMEKTLSDMTLVQDTRVLANEKERKDIETRLEALEKTLRDVKDSQAEDKVKLNLQMEAAINNPDIAELKSKLQLMEKSLLNENESKNALRIELTDMVRIVENMLRNILDIIAEDKVKMEELATLKNSHLKSKLESLERLLLDEIESKNTFRSDLIAMHCRIKTIEKNSRLSDTWEAEPSMSKLVKLGTNEHLLTQQRPTLVKNRNELQTLYGNSGISLFQKKTV